MIVANLYVLPKVAKPHINLDPLNTIAWEVANEGDADNEVNVKIFLNLHNIEDVKMLTDSAKRQRLEKGDECSIH